MVISFVGKSPKTVFRANTTISPSVLAHDQIKPKCSYMQRKEETCRWPKLKIPSWLTCGLKAALGKLAPDAGRGGGGGGGGGEGQAGGQVLSSGGAGRGRSSATGGGAGKAGGGASEAVGKVWNSGGGAGRSSSSGGGGGGGGGKSNRNEEGWEKLAATKQRLHSIRYPEHLGWDVFNDLWLFLWGFLNSECRLRTWVKLGSVW